MMDHLATTSNNQAQVLCEPSPYPPCKVARMENAKDLPVAGVAPPSLASKQTSPHAVKPKGIYRNTHTKTFIVQYKQTLIHNSFQTGNLLPVFCMVEHGDGPPSERKRSEHTEFVLLRRDLLFSQITEAALQELGYTHTAAALATGTHVPAHKLKGSSTCECWTHIDLLLINIFFDNIKHFGCLD